MQQVALENAASAFLGARFTIVVAMNVNIVWTQPVMAGAALRALLDPRGRVLLGVEPPASRDPTAMLERLRRAAAPAGFIVSEEYTSPARRVVAVEWRLVPRAG